tara:strand:- start:3072 stop:3824 length:753 start_codon:yes stop_codon:yes gene_type:complete
MKKIDDLLLTINKLRSENGCEWDKKQTSESLIPYLIEEVYEVIDSIDKKNSNNLLEELGDLLIHVLFQCDIANDKEQFNLDDVILLANQKLINRHPNIFSQKVHSNNSNWELNKQKFKNRKYLLDGIPSNLPSLIKAQRLQEKAASTGFDWDNIGQVWDKLKEEIQELKQAKKSKVKDEIEEEIGDVLFTIVNLCRFFDISPDNALRKSNYKFLKRFNGIEDELKKENKKFENISIDEMNALWNKQKQII